MTLDLKVSKTFDDIYEAYAKRYRLIVAYGSSRSGKTYSIMQLFCILLMSRKSFKITVWRATRIDAIATVLEDFKAVVETDPLIDQQFIYNKKDATFTHVKTRSVIHFMGTDKIGKVLGMRQDISFFNEISHFKEDVYKQIAQRTTETIFSDYNPSRDFFIQKYESREDSIFLRSTFEDNIEFLTEGIVNQLRGYNPFAEGSTYVENNTLMYNGEPVSHLNEPPRNELNFKNGTADKYMWEVYGLGLKSEKPNRVFRGWKTCTPEYFDNVDSESYYGLDFGVSKPTALVEVKYDGDRTFYVRQRLYRPSSKMGTTVADFVQNRLNPPITPKDLVVADSAKKTMVEDLKQGGLFAFGAKKGPGSVHRRISLVQSFNIVYDETSHDLEDEYVEYSYKLDRYGLTTDDIDPSCEDHLLDAMGYIISYLIRYLNIRVAA